VRIWSGMRFVKASLTSQCTAALKHARTAISPVGLQYQLSEPKDQKRRLRIGFGMRMEDVNQPHRPGSDRPVIAVHFSIAALGPSQRSDRIVRSQPAVNSSIAVLPSLDSGQPGGACHDSPQLRLRDQRQAMRRAIVYAAVA
jgi:hypothetical protein